MGGLGGHYSYYAPLGAVVAMTTAVVDSVRSSAQAVLAICLGAAISLLVIFADVPVPMDLAVALVVAVLVGGWSRVGPMSTWVPLAAMFVLVAGADHPLRYTAAYAGLTALGAAVGIGVNMLLPQLPLSPSAIAQDRLRRELARELETLANALEREIVKDQDWAGLRAELARHAHHSEALMLRVRESRRANWYADHYAETTERNDQRARALQRLSGSVDQVIALITDQRTDIRRDEPASAELRACVSSAIAAVAAMVREGDADPEGAAEASTRARESVERLSHQVVQTQSRSPLPHLAAAAIALDLEQAVDAWQ
jgi:uncharacterized membrane protein YgaE (UPF0421/DUF939 family)